MKKYKDFKRHFASLLGELQGVIAELEGTQRLHMRMITATLEGVYRALLEFDGDAVPASELTKKKKTAPNPKWGAEIKSPELLKALAAFEEMRIKKKKPMTELARHRLYKELLQLSLDEKTQIAILEQSIFNSWNGVFPLHDAPQLRQTKEPTKADKDAAAFQASIVKRFMEG